MSPAKGSPARFFGLMLVTAPSTEVLSSESAWQAYTAWCADRGAAPVARRHHGRNTRRYEGRALRTDVVNMDVLLLEWETLVCSVLAHRAELLEAPWAAQWTSCRLFVSR